MPSIHKQKPSLENMLPHTESQAIIMAEKYANLAHEDFDGNIDLHYQSGFLCGYKAGSQWISCKDRLPQNDDRVLIVLIRDGILQYTIDRYLIHWWKVNEFLPLYNVTHWMPLPKPPNDIPNDIPNL